MDGRRRLWFEGVELGRAKAGSIDEVIARITGLLIGLRGRGGGSGSSLGSGLGAG